MSIILTAVSSNKVDAIEHWCEHRNIAWFKPFLALEYLSTPATSAPIEIVFSVCGHIFSAYLMMKYKIMSMHLYVMTQVYYNSVSNEVIIYLYQAIV